MVSFSQPPDFGNSTAGALEIASFPELSAVGVSWVVEGWEEEIAADWLLFDVAGSAVLGLID